MLSRVASQIERGKKATEVIKLNMLVDKLVLAGIIMLIFND